MRWECRNSSSISGVIASVSRAYLPPPGQPWPRLAELLQVLLPVLQDRRLPEWGQWLPGCLAQDQFAADPAAVPMLIPTG